MTFDDNSGYLIIPDPHLVPPRWAVGGAELGEELASRESAPKEQEAAHPPTRLAGEIAGVGRPTHEALLGLVAGMAYGAASPLAGHPFDTIKTRCVHECLCGSVTGGVACVSAAHKDLRQIAHARVRETPIRGNSK
jgi:hypothetical protein